MLSSYAHGTLQLHNLYKGDHLKKAQFNTKLNPIGSTVRFEVVKLRTFSL